MFALLMRECLILLAGVEGVQYRPEISDLNEVRQHDSPKSNQTVT
jgi:hypothetical protein